MKEFTAGLAVCMEEGDGRDARAELAKKYGWEPISHPSPVLTESWEHKKTISRIDYFPMTDRTIFCNTDTGKKVVRDSIGGNIGLGYSLLR